MLVSVIFEKLRLETIRKILDRLIEICDERIPSENLKETDVFNAIICWGEEKVKTEKEDLRQMIDLCWSSN
jgi:hypothetical protein